MKWFLARFKYAYYGFLYALKDHSVFIQCLFGLIVFVAGIFFRLDVYEWFWIGLCIVLVIVMETLNSCIEGLVDYISLERNEQAKRIKDMAAFAVLAVSGFSAIVGLAIFLPKIFYCFL